MNLKNLDYKLAHPFRDPDRVKQVHDAIEKMINQERPNPEDFGGIIPDQEIQDDVKKVSDLEKQWASSNTPEVLEIKRKADIAEYLIYKNLGTWIDQKAVPLITAKADDYLRGIDLVIESEAGSGEDDENKKLKHLGLGIDVALASEKGISHSVESKKEKIRKMLKNGNLTEARYVSGGSFEGKLENLTYTILSVSPSHIEDLFSGVLKTGSSEKEKTHILKYILAYQIIRQLGTFYKISEHRGKDHLAYRYGIANNFAYDIFGELMDQIKADPDIWKKVSEDVGVMEIEDLCNGIEKELS